MAEGGTTMGQAREVVDRMTEAMMTRDVKALEGLYAPNAVFTTPDQGEITGREAVVDYLRGFIDAFPDLQWEELAKHESGNTTIDEGHVVGTNTAPLPLRDGQKMPATGKKVRVRSCDIATVKDGLIVQHNFYFDQMEFLGQLGLLPDQPA
ncbi:MAG: nuclear transport factor 2 family protein [Frankia sp.]|nr:nuclear transport factor 2 family protein [Frankia sp.]